MPETPVLSNGTVTRSLERGLDVLLLFMRDGGRLGVTEIARRTGLSKATVWRLLASLERKGFVTQDEERSYRLTFGLLALAAALLKDVDLADQSDSVMRELCAETGETVGLYVRVGMSRMCVHQVESTQELRRVGKVGEPKPLTTGSVGRLLLAFSSRREVDEILAAQPLEARTPFSLTDAAQFHELLDEVREQGFALAIEESVHGVSGIAVPVLGADGEVAAALNVSGPSDRWTASRMRELAPLLIERAAAIAARLGLGVAPRGLGEALGGVPAATHEAEERS